MLDPPPVGFNGAAAFQPRKGKELVDIDNALGLQWCRGFSAAESVFLGNNALQPYGFNGAAAFQPRKDPHPHHERASTRASMVPRLFSRGKPR